MRGVLEEHEIDDAKHYSILSDILFQFSYFLDQHQDSYLHEEIDSYMLDTKEFISGEQNEIVMLGELEIVFGNKRKFTTNIMNIDLIDKRYLLDNLIGLLRLEDIGDNLNTIELDEKFKVLVIEKREGIYALRFRKLEDLSNDNWFELVCKDYKYDCSNNMTELANIVSHFISQELNRI